MIQNFPKTRFFGPYLFKITVVFTMVLILQGCMKDDFSKISTGAWGPDFAVPVINTRLVLTDFLKANLNGYVKEDSATHYLTAIYKGTPFTQNANAVLRVDSQAATIPIKTPPGMSQFASFPMPKDTVISDTSSNVCKFSNANNAQIETLKIRSGVLKIAVVSDFKFSGEIAITFPTFKNGNLKNIVVVVPFNYVNGIPTMADSSVSLSNAIADMSNNGTGYNTLPISYKFTARLKKGDIFDASQKITVNLLMKKVIFSYIDGYFGSLPLDLRESFPIGLFHYLKSGSLNLKAPRADFTIKNSYGLPIDLLFTTLRVRTLNNDSFPFAGPEISNTIHFPYPGINEVGQVKSKLISINPSTSNISTVISKSPVKFEYLGKVTSNPNGKIPGNKNFIIDSSKASVDVNISIPLWGTATNFTAQDTFAFSMPSVDIVEAMTIKINTENGFPLDVDMQLYFADSLNHVLDSLVLKKDRFLRSGIVDTSGNVIAPTFTTITADIDRSRFPKIKTTKKILLKGVLNTTLNPDGTQSAIRVSSRNYLGVRLGVRAKLKFGK